MSSHLIYHISSDRMSTFCWPCTAWGSPQSLWSPCQQPHSGTLWHASNTQTPPPPWDKLSNIWIWPATVVFGDDLIEKSTFLSFLSPYKEKMGGICSTEEGPFVTSDVAWLRPLSVEVVLTHHGGLVIPNGEPEIIREEGRTVATPAGLQWNNSRYRKTFKAVFACVCVVC